MEHTYTTSGTCSRAIHFEIDESGTLRNVRFDGGCAGNTVGLATMCEGRKASEVAALLSGIDCRQRGTSCPDQLAKAIAEALAK